MGFLLDQVSRQRLHSRRAATSQPSLERADRVVPDRFCSHADRPASLTHPPFFRMVLDGFEILITASRDERHHESDDPFRYLSLGNRFI